MQKSDFNQHLYSIVVGSSVDEFVRDTINLLDEYDVEFALCDDAYLAVGELAKNRFGDVLVIGRVGHLNIEQGRLFHIANENNYKCCCFADKNSDQKWKQILAAKQTGAFIISEPAELREIITKLLEDNAALPLNKTEEKVSSNFNKNEFLTTKAELDALLETKPTFQ